MATDTSENNGNDGISEAALFEAIAHETRIHILFLLRDHPMGFSELKRELGIKSSGNLQHHLGKLTSLVESNGNGDYSLTDIGSEAILTIRSIRNVEDRTKFNLKLFTLVAILAYYVVELNIPFITGSVDALTPISALIETLGFGIIFYVFMRTMSKVVEERRAETLASIIETE